MPLENVIEFISADVKEGDVIRLPSINNDDKATAHLEVKHMRKLINKLSEFYSKGETPSQETFLEIFEKYRDNMSKEVNNIFEQLEKSEEFFKVKKKTVDKEGSITIKMVKIDPATRISLIKSIAQKILKKLKPEQLLSMLEEGIKKNPHTEELKKIDKELDQEDVKISDSKGCWELSVNDKTIFTMM